MKITYLIVLLFMLVAWTIRAQEVEPNDTYDEATVINTFGPFEGTPDADWQGDMWRLELAPGTYTLDWVGDTCTRVRVIEFDSSYDPAVETPNSTPGASSSCTFVSLSYGCRLVDNLDDGFDAVISESFTVVAGRYYFFFKNPHDCFGSDYDTGGGTLPVDLADFTAKVEGQTVVFEWTTLTEINNKGFEIEQSLDAINFETIGTLDGAGNSETALDYQYVYSCIGTGLLYFRLKQLDYDGRYRYFKTIAVELKKQAQVMDMTLNYVRKSNLIHVKLPEQSDKKYHMDLIDCLGHIHHQTNFYTDGTFISLDLPEGLKHGPYIIHVYNNETSHKQKILMY